jgi:sulfur-oxidizing protein SoxA
MLCKTLIVTGIAAMVAVGFSSVGSAEEDWGAYQVGDLRSGYTYATAETRAMQDDDFANPSFIWYDKGAALWSKAEGEAGKSCASCHGDDAASMKGVGNTFPKYNAALGKPVNIEQQINLCRVNNMKAEEYKWESDEMLGMTVFVKHQSVGMPINVDISGPMMSFWEKGKEFYNQRRGLLDMACSNCHVDNAGKMLRANLLTQGMANGFPTYRLKWSKVGSLHRRFKGCNTEVRAEPYGYGSEEYINLEVFLTHRGNGLPLETPSVRN